jgi:hypothetical protein
MIDVRRRLGRREPCRAGAHGFAHERRHLLDLAVRRLALGCGFAHDEAAHRGVPDVDADVDAEALVEDVQQRREAVPVPRQPLLEHRRRHALDLREELHHPLAVAGLARGDRVAAVTGDDRRDAVVAGRRRMALERHLRS